MKKLAPLNKTRSFCLKQKYENSGVGVRYRSENVAKSPPPQVFYRPNHFENRARHVSKPVYD